MNREQLIQDYLDDALMEEQVGELRALLREDEAGLDQFIRAADLHGFLAGLRTEKVASPIPVVERRRASRRPVSRPASGRSPAWLAAVAASLFLGILLLVLASTSPTPARVAKERFRTDGSPVVVTSRTDPDPLAEKVNPYVEQRVEPAPPLPLIPRRFDPSVEEPLKPRPAEEKRPSIDVPVETAKPAMREPVRPTSVSLAVAPRIERIEGNVYLARSRTDKPRAKKSDAVPVEVDVETAGASSFAVIRFDDNTLVELGGNSSFRVVGEGRVALNYGTLLASVEKQPVDQPMVFLSPTAEATVLGTTLRLTVTANPKPLTTLEVKEGKVRFTRLLDRKSVEVVTGQFAVADVGGELRPQRNLPDEVTIRFGPSDIASAVDMWVDSGEEFDPTRGYGWIGPKNGDAIPGLFWRNPNTGILEAKMSGRFAVRRTNDPKVDPLKSTDVVAGWAGHAETWRMPVPNGRYLVTVCCGEAITDQGPHHVSIEGLQVINQVKNRAGQFIEVKDVPIEVRDGELTMKVGGHQGILNSRDSSGTSDTIINYLILKRVVTSPR